MSPVYEFPVISKLQHGVMNKFGPSPAYARKVRREIDGVAVDDLVARHGSPLFVYSERLKPNEGYLTVAACYLVIYFVMMHLANFAQRRLGGAGH